MRARHTEAVRGHSHRVGDLVETHKGVRGVITATEMMYAHPQSPVGSIAVEWDGDAPKWWRRGLFFEVFAVKVVSRAPVPSFIRRR